MLQEFWKTILLRFWQTVCVLYKILVIIETGSSYFHKMVTMKTTFRKLEPKVIKCHDYKYLFNNTFTESLQTPSHRIWKVVVITLTVFSCKDVLLKIAHQKKFYEGKSLVIYEQNLIKRNNFVKNRNKENRKNYTMQRSCCFTLAKK